MFRDIVKPSVSVGSRKALVVPLSIAAHVAVVAIVFLVGIMAPGVLPAPTAALLAFVSRDVVLPPEPPPPPVSRAAAESRPIVVSNPDAAPLDAPASITPETPVAVAPIAVMPGVVEGTAAIADLVGVNAAPPSPPLAPADRDAIRVGGSIRPPARVKDVSPVYPPIAQAARVQGIVIIETTIGVTGRVVDAKILKSIALLDGAALDAVRQWEFTPTLLNGSPVPVVMTVTVRFELN